MRETVSEPSPATAFSSIPMPPIAREGHGLSIQTKGGPETGSMQGTNASRELQTTHLDENVGTDLQQVVLPELCESKAQAVQGVDESPFGHLGQGVGALGVVRSHVAVLAGPRPAQSAGGAVRRSLQVDRARARPSALVARAVT